jgi:hypothetical protein
MIPSKRTLVVRRVGARPHVVRIGKGSSSREERGRRAVDPKREVLEHDGTRPVHPNERDDDY